MTCLRAEVSSSESEKVLSGSEKSTCKSCCIRAMGSPILPTTAAKSTWANWLILLKTSGTNSEHNVATTTQITARVASAASQRGTCHPLKCTPARRLTPHDGQHGRNEDVDDDRREIPDQKEHDRGDCRARDEPQEGLGRRLHRPMRFLCSCAAGRSGSATPRWDRRSPPTVRCPSARAHRRATRI